MADGLTQADVFDAVGIAPDDPVAEDVLTAFEDGYAAGVEDEVVRAARAILTDSFEEER